MAPLLRCFEQRQKILSAYAEGLQNKRWEISFAYLRKKEKMLYNDQEWGQKDVELEKIVDLPLLVPEATLEMSVAGISKNYPDHNWLLNKGWKFSEDLNIINNSLIDYRNYIQHSFGEFSVAKETYVKANTGWFSDRSACYLAAGRPVVVQETQWSKFIPKGKGALSFSTVESAKLAVEDIIHNYKMHSNAAKELANEYFDSSKVLSAMIDQIN